MLHLPDSFWPSRSIRSFNPSNKLGLAVRGLYGEGTEALGNISRCRINDARRKRNHHCRAAGQVFVQITSTRKTRGRRFGEKPKVVYNHIGRLRHFCQRAQHFVEGNDEPAFVHALGVTWTCFCTERASVDELFILTSRRICRNSFRTNCPPRNAI